MNVALSIWADLSRRGAALILCERGPRGEPVCEGASRSFSRISLSTRRRDVRTPAKRSLAQTLRWLSPWKRLAASTAWIASTSNVTSLNIDHL